MRQMLIVLCLSGSAWAAEAPQQAALSQKAIDAAVAKGLDYLKVAPKPHAHGQFKDSDELLMLTAVHGGMSEKNPWFTEMLERKLVAPLEKTYKVALLAMTLEELDRVKYQLKIAECAQFLIDNQAANGQWSYGRPTDTTVNIKDIPSVASGTKKKRKAPGLRRFGALKEKPKVVRKIRISQNKTTGTQGDNSNSQYASLGLRACFDAGIIVDEQAIYKARQWWVESQHPAEDGAGDAKAVASGGARPRGWSYTNLERDPDRKAYHAMSAGAIGAVCIYDYMLGKNFKTDQVAKDGVEWLGKKFVVSQNYYYMYAVERAGMLYGTDKFGDHDWYIEGAKYILSKQNADGSWSKRGDDGRPSDVWNTCFCILFLKKATRMIATGGGN